jgi:hypothetical protein
VLIDPLDPPPDVRRVDQVLVTVYWRGIRPFQTARAAEVAYWLPDQHGLVVGDVLLGAGAKPRPTDAPLRLCPERWLGKQTHDDLRASLRPVLELPVERVLVSHGKPVLRDRHAALADVL